MGERHWGYPWKFHVRFIQSPHDHASVGTVSRTRSLKQLLAGDPGELERQIRSHDYRRVLGYAAVTAVGTAVYGATFGLWRSELQALSTALKFPLVIFLTCAGNGLLNGLIGVLLGTGLGLRESAVAILMSFTITALVLAGFAPVMLFVLWNTPGMGSAQAGVGQSITLLAHVAAIAIAGYIGNVRLWRLLRCVTGSDWGGHRVLFAWLAGNLLLGSQVAWILRPWTGAPGSPISFLSPEPLHGNFFEAVGAALQNILHHTSQP